MEADADIGRGPYLAVKRAIVGENVEMVGACRAAGEGQLGQPGDRADVDGLIGQVGPNGVERLEPREQVGILGDDAGQALIEMMVGVDEARQNDMVAQVEDGVGRLGQVGGRTDGLDHVIAHEQPAAGDLATVVVHGDEHFGILDK